MERENNKTTTRPYALECFCLCLEDVHQGAEIKLRIGFLVSPVVAGAQLCHHRQLGVMLHLGMGPEAYILHCLWQSDDVSLINCLLLARGSVWSREVRRLGGVRLCRSSTIAEGKGN